MADRRAVVGVVGATSPVGQLVVAELAKMGHTVVAFSRRPQSSDASDFTWATLSVDAVPQIRAVHGDIELWIAACNIWVLPNHVELMSKLGAARIACLSSTSRFTKSDSGDVGDLEVARLLVGGEDAIVRWGTEAGVQWTILRPTLIYGRSTDRNLAEIVRLIRRLRFYPIFGKAEGLRQPVYVDDVASALVRSAYSSTAIDRAYNISGGEVLSYRQMISRVFVALGMRPRFFRVPIWAFRVALLGLRLIPRYRKWNPAMVARTNQDMTFDHTDARRDFGFDPQPFRLSAIDLDA